MLNINANYIGRRYPSASGLVGITEGIVRAYSVRLINPSYTGALIRLRKDVVGQPEKDFYPDSNGELSDSSSDGSGSTMGSWVGANDSYIVTFYDQSGLAKNASQAVEARQAKLHNSGTIYTKGGKAAPYYNNAWYTFDNFDEDNFSMLAVYAPDIATRNTSAFLGYDLSLTTWFYITATEHNFRVGGTGKSLTSVNANGERQLITAYKNNVNAQVCKNNVSLGTFTDYGTLSLLANSMGSVNNGTWYLNGFMQEFILIEQDAVAVQAALHENINDHFSIY